MKALSPIAFSALVLAGCGGGLDLGDSLRGTGTVRVALTDAPACGFDAVHVTIEKVRLHDSANAGEGDRDWREIEVTPPRRVDLLTLTNGTLLDLGETTLPAVRYRQLRLVLKANDNTTPLANAVTPAGGREVALDTPSGTQSGLKAEIDVTISRDATQNLAIDFDACKSVTERGNSGRYNLHPVLRVIAFESAETQRVVGHVASALATGATTVSLQSDGVPVRSTPPDASGRFVLAPVPAGTYDLVIAAPGRVNTVITGVPVTTRAATELNAANNPLDPPASASQRSARGSVSVAGSSAIPPATVRALQEIARRNVEVAAAPVNADTGAFELRLPAGAPVSTTFPLSGGAPPWVLDLGEAGRYRLETRAPERSTQSADIDVSSGDTTTVFVFP